MLPTHQYVKTHSGCKIYRREPGFEFTPITLGKIASFIVQGTGGSVTVFAFMYSMLIMLDGETVDESELLEKAVETIQSHIDAGRIRNRQELTFEYHQNTYVKISSPRWWVSSFE